MHVTNSLTIILIIFSLSLRACQVANTEKMGCRASDEAASKVLSKSEPKITNVTYHTKKINGLDIFYREAGSKDNPTIVLLHGFPTSSHMFRNLMPALSKNFHLIAPDYPGFGNSSMPLVSEFDYTFDNLANIIDKLLQSLKVNKYILYIMDYGAPVGFRIALKHPKRVNGFIIQNGNAYAEGLLDFWKPFRAFWKERNPNTEKPLLDLLTLKTTKFQYMDGTQDKQKLSPDTWIMDQYFLDRPGNQDIQLELFYDYRSNLKRYPAWQSYLRKYQPRVLIVWGKNDTIFPIEGAYPYKKDLKNVELHELNTGHFALEEEWPFIADRINDYFAQSK